MRFSKTLLLLAITAALAVGASADTGRFLEPLRVTLPASGYSSVVLADFNGDGRPDIAAAEYFGPTIDVALATRNGFGPVVSYTADLGEQAMAVGDLNHDGNLDLVTVSDSVNVLLGNGDGTFQPPFKYSLATDDNTSITVADFNGDGNPDVAVGTGRYRTDISVVVLLGNGDGTFSAGPTLGHAGPAAAAGDVNGDGKIDLVAGSAASVRVFLGKGDGNFQQSVSYNTSGMTFDLALADFNHDGKLDIVTIAYYKGLASVLLGNGNGTFQSRVDYGIVAFSFSLAVTDLNGDGNMDLLVGSDAGLSVLFGNGDGTLRRQTLYGGFPQPTAIATGDVNGDGQTDVVTVNSNAYYCYASLLINTGFGKLLAAPEYDNKNTAIALAEGDLNNDGKDDVIVSSRYLGGITVTAWLGNGAQRLQRRVTPVSAFYEFLVSGDFNNDGRLDAFSVTPAPVQYAVLLGNGDGTFQELAPQTLAGANAPVVGDFNRDGNLDVALLGYRGQPIYILLGKGDGTFAAPLSLPESQEAFSFTVADFNKDGELDLAVGGRNPDDVLIYIGNGDGTFQAPIVTPVKSDFFILKSADLNGDGIPDLVGASTDLCVLIGNGDGTFQPPVEYPYAPSYYLLIGDFNLDGKPDLAFGEDIHAYAFVKLLLNNGDGTFVADDADYFAGDQGAVVGDFNQDGFPDIAALNYLGYSVNPLQILLNTGK